MEEIQSEQGWLPALPGEDDFVTILSLDVLLNMGFENLVAYAEFARASQQILLVQVITVTTVEITDGTDRFDHGVIGTPGSGLHRKGRQIDLNQITHLSWTFSRCSRICRFRNIPVAVLASARRAIRIRLGRLVVRVMRHNYL